MYVCTYVYMYVHVCVYVCVCLDSNYFKSHCNNNLFPLVTGLGGENDDCSYRGFIVNNSDITCSQRFWGAP